MIVLTWWYLRARWELEQSQKKNYRTQQILAELLNTYSRCIRHSFHLLTCIISSLPYKKFSSLLEDSIIVYLDNLMSFGGNGCIYPKHPKLNDTKHKKKEGECEYKTKLSLLRDTSFAKSYARWFPSWKMRWMWVSSKSYRGICNQILKHLQGWDESDKASYDVRIVTTTFASSSMYSSSIFRFFARTRPSWRP